VTKDDRFNIGLASVQVSLVTIAFAASRRSLETKTAPESRS
jgi:hypothetical protein